MLLDADRRHAQQGGEHIYSSIAAHLALDAARMKLIHRGKILSRNDIGSVLRTADASVVVQVHANPVLWSVR